MSTVDQKRKDDSVAPPAPPAAPRTSVKPGQVLTSEPTIVGAYQPPPSSPKRWAAGIAALIALTLIVVVTRKPSDDATVIPPAPPVSDDILTEIGNIEALSETQVLTRFNGDVIWKIEEGTFVEAGDPVIKQETRSFEEDLESREKDLAIKKDAVRRAQADIAFAKQKSTHTIRQQEIALALAEVEKRRIFDYPTSDDTLDVQLTLQSAELELKKSEQEFAGYEELAQRGFVSDAAKKKKQLELAGKRINHSKAKLIHDLTLQGYSDDTKRLAEMAVADAKKRLQITNFNFEADLNVLQANLELAQLDLANFERDLARRRKELDAAVTRAPTRGRVAFVDVWKGSSRSMSPIQVGETRAHGSDVCKICDTSSLRINVFVNETDIHRVRLKQRATVTLPAFPNRKFDAIVSEIGVVATDKNAALSSLAIRSAGEAFVNVVGVKLDFVGLKEEDRRDIRINFSADVQIQLDPESESKPQSRNEETGARSSQVSLISTQVVSQANAEAAR